MQPVTLSITVNTTEQLLAVSAAIAAASGAKVPDTSTPSASTSAPSSAAATKPAPVAAPPAATPQAQGEPERADAIDYETLKKVFLDLSNRANGREKCARVLKAFGVEKLPHVPKEKYAEAMAAMEKEIGA